MDETYTVLDKNIVALINNCIQSDIIFRVFRKKYKGLLQSYSITKGEEGWQLIIKIWEENDEQQIEVFKKAFSSFNFL